MRRNINQKYITYEDFRTFYNDFIGVADEKQIKAVFKNVDVDRSNSIDMNEFIKAFMGEHYYKFNVQRKIQVESIMKEMYK